MSPTLQRSRHALPQSLNEQNTVYTLFDMRPSRVSHILRLTFFDCLHPDVYLKNYFQVSNENYSRLSLLFQKVIHVGLAYSKALRIIPRALRYCICR